MSELGILGNGHNSIVMMLFLFKDSVVTGSIRKHISYSLLITLPRPISQSTSHIQFRTLILTYRIL